MWFVGTIIVYYLAYPFMVYFSKNIKYMLAAMAALLVVFVLLYTPLHIIKDGHVPLFISVFAGGIIANKINLFYNKDYEKYFAVLPVILVITLLVDIKLFDSGSFVLNESFSIIKFGFYFFFRNILLLTVSILSFLSVRPFIGYLDRRARDIFTKLSYGSYAAYLFHMQLFPILMLALDLAFKNTLIADATLLVLGLPLALILGYYIQKYFDMLIKNARKTIFPTRTVS